MKGRGGCVGTVTVVFNPSSFKTRRGIKLNDHLSRAVNAKVELGLYGPIEGRVGR